MTKKVTPKEFIIGSSIIIILCTIIIISIFYTPYDPNSMHTDDRFLAPTIKYLFGTDNFGRDVLSRIMVGLKYSLTIAFFTVFISSFMGIFIGLFSANLNNKYIDEIIMRMVDAINSIPTILLTLVLTSIFSRNNKTFILALSIVFTPSFIRIIRNEALQIKQLEYIQHAKVLGANNFRIMSAHVFPNLIPTLLSTIIISLSNVILVESSLSYLGLGIQPPTPSLGRMLFESQSFLFNAPWNAIFPGIIIVITVIGFNYLGEGLRKML